MAHPFLDSAFHIPWQSLTPERVQPDIERALAEAEERLEALASTPLDKVSFENSFLALESATEDLSRAWGLVNHLDSVNNSPELRTAINTMLPRVTEFFAGIPLNPRIWKVLKTFAESPAAQKLGPVERRFLDETVAGFRESGADLPEDRKKAFEALQRELAEKTQKFTENDLDSTNAFELLVDDASRLRGLPESYREAARRDARAKGLGTDEQPIYRFTLKAPSYGPALRYLDDDELRHQLWDAATRVASKDPHDNTPLIWEILRLRREKARLLGKAHFADLVLERRMAKSGRAALDFIEDLHARTKPAFDRENKELEDFKAATLGKPSGPLNPWEQDYWAEKLRRQRYDLDEEELRPYFSLEKVLEGCFRITEQLFGLKIRLEAQQPQVWHPEVRFYTIEDARDGRHLGSFYTDWYPRDTKRSGAWMNYLITGDRLPTRFTPHLGLMCGNLNPPVGETPALLTHRDVETIFHEFGHLLHHLLGEVSIRSLNGVHVAWDFVELPSQILENWCWERESLDLFARHYQTGAPIPEPLFQKMRAARSFHAARAQMRQLSLGKMDLELHVNFERFVGRDLDTTVRELLADYLIPSAVPYRHILRRFGHLFGDPVGYAAGYYSYKWAEVLDADAFTRFQKEGILNTTVGQAFREHILSCGNADDPALLFERFMGRGPDPQALLRRNGLLV